MLNPQEARDERVGGMSETVADVLTAKRDEIQGELAALSAPADDAGGISFGKRVGDGTSIAVERITQVDAHGRLQSMLADTVRALAKLDEGTYGVCDGCGQPIAADRLEARPWSARCVACAT
jgi:DnaK suppressor protein